MSYDVIQPEGRATEIRRKIFLVIEWEDNMKEEI